MKKKVLILTILIVFITSFTFLGFLVKESAPNENRLWLEENGYDSIEDYLSGKWCVQPPPYLNVIPYYFFDYCGYPSIVYPYYGLYRDSGDITSRQSYPESLNNYSYEATDLYSEDVELKKNEMSWGEEYYETIRRCDTMPTHNLDGHYVIDDYYIVIEGNQFITNTEKYDSIHKHYTIDEPIYIQQYDDVLLTIDEPIISSSHVFEYWLADNGDIWLLPAMVEFYGKSNEHILNNGFFKVLEKQDYSNGGNEK